MNISEHKLNLIRQIDQLPEESLLELEKNHDDLTQANKKEFKTAIGLHERSRDCDGERL